MAAECQPCTEVANDNYTLHTGRVTVCLQSDGIVRDLGNISELTFRFTPEFLEHFRGEDGQLDALIPLRRGFTIEGVLDELTPSNMSILLGEAQVPNTPSGCIIPLRGPSGDCASAIASVEFVHTMSCLTKTVTFRLWRAAIGAEAEIVFGGDDFLNFPVSFRALDCSSVHPTSPFGEIEFSEACVLS